MINWTKKKPSHEGVYWCNIDNFIWVAFIFYSEKFQALRCHLVYTKNGSASCVWSMDSAYFDGALWAKIDVPEGKNS